MRRKILSIPHPEARRRIRGSRTSWVEHFEDEDGAWYVKTYRYRGLRAALRGAFRNTFAAPSRATRELRALELLARTGVQPDLEAEVSETRRFAFLREAVLLTRDFGGQDLAARLAEHPGDAGLSDETWKALGRFVHALHEAGLRDPDLKARNILVRQDSGTGEWLFAKIDSSSSKIVPAQRKDAARVRDLEILRDDLRRSKASPRVLDVLRSAYESCSQG